MRHTTSRTTTALLAAVGTAVGTAVAGCADPARLTRPASDTAPLTARGGGAPAPAYDVVTYPATLGGAANRANAISNRGWLAGYSSLPDGTRHAALWRGVTLTDLGTLGGPNSSVAWPGLSNPGLVVGIAQTATPDPLGERWSCASFFLVRNTGYTCLGFVWEQTRSGGVMTALPTLGGNNSYATAVNSRGQVVGWAETAVHDPTCDAPQVLQFRAVVWEREAGRSGRYTATELRPLPGDSASAATAINERGQVVGISGECDQAVGRFTAKHAVLWERDGTPVTLPTLGGLSWHTPTAINARGDVVGFSNPPGEPPGEFIAHAFLWTRKDGIRDLGTLPGDAVSQAQGVNARGQVVGVSFGGPAGQRAFLWEDGVMYDLNALVGAGAPGVLVSARDVNDAGQITGDLREAGTGRTVPFVATSRPARP
jgi:probable HAF family extracellular repeat protein